MSGVDKKRKGGVDEEDLSSAVISVDKSQVSNKSYFDLPEELIREQPPPDFKKCWFTYDKKKYFPICLVDKNEISTDPKAKMKILNKKQVKLQFSLAVYSADSPSPETDIAYSAEVQPTGNTGVYWFQLIKPHVAGIMKCCIKSTNYSDVISELKWDVMIHEDTSLPPSTFFTDNSVNKKKSSSRSSKITQTKSSSSTSSITGLKANAEDESIQESSHKKTKLVSHDEDVKGESTEVLPKSSLLLPISSSSSSRRIISSAVDNSKDKITSYFNTSATISSSSSSSNNHNILEHHLLTAVEASTSPMEIGISGNGSTSSSLVPSSSSTNKGKSTEGDGGSIISSTTGTATTSTTTTMSANTGNKRGRPKATVPTSPLQELFSLLSSSSSLLTSASSVQQQLSIPVTAAEGRGAQKGKVEVTANTTNKRTVATTTTAVAEVMMTSKEDDDNDVIAEAEENGADNSLNFILELDTKTAAARHLKTTATISHHHHFKTEEEDDDVVTGDDNGDGYDIDNDDDVLFPFPSQEVHQTTLSHLLTTTRKLTRPLPLPLSSSLLSSVQGSSSIANSNVTNNGVLSIQGKVLKITFPTALVIALLDDKSRVSSFLPLTTSSTVDTNSNVVSKSKAYQHKNNSSNKHKLHLIQTHNDIIKAHYEKYNTPCVHDILLRIQKDAKSKAAILDAEEMFKLIRCAFQVYFEPSVLYAIEREYHIYGEKLEHIKMNKKHMLSTQFCAIYLLRFLVFLAVGVDTAISPAFQIINNASAASGTVTTLETSSSPIKSGRDRSASTTSETPSSSSLLDTTATTTSSTSSSTSSASRRHHLNTKQLLTNANKFQEVLSYIIRDLDQSAHFLFP